MGITRISYIAQNPKMNKAYDNFNFLEYRSGERIGDRKTFISLTNSIIFEGYRMPHNGLKQHIWHPERPLQAVQIVRNIVADTYFKAVRLLLSRLKYTKTL